MAALKNIIWNGSAWVECIPTVWTGSAWVNEHSNVWNGSSWIAIPNWEWSGPYPGVVMTSQSAPAPFITSASSNYNTSNYSAYMAFNQDYSNANGWVTTSGVSYGWIRLYFATPLRNIMVTICNRTRSSLVNGVIAATIEASNDGTNWTQIGTISGRDGATSGYANSYYCSHDDTYTWVRIYVTDWNNRTASSDDYLAIGELYVYGYKAT